MRKLASNQRIVFGKLDQEGTGAGQRVKPTNCVVDRSFIATQALSVQTLFQQVPHYNCSEYVQHSSRRARMTIFRMTIEYSFGRMWTNYRAMAAPNEMTIYHGHVFVPFFITFASFIIIYSKEQFWFPGLTIMNPFASHLCLLFAAMFCTS